MKECCREVLWESVVEKCWGRVLERSVGESVVERCCGEVLAGVLGKAV